MRGGGQGRTVQTARDSAWKKMRVSSTEGWVGLEGVVRERIDIGAVGGGGVA